MQAVGMVNDHTTDCFRYTELKGILDFWQRKAKEKNILTEKQLEKYLRD